MTTRILHPITRLIIGGAQENTILTAALLPPNRWDVDVVCGPQSGPEGSLINVARKQGVSLIIEPSLVREINPLKDPLALFRLTRLIRRGGYAIVHTHSSKAGILGRWAAKLAGTPVIVHTVHGWGHHDRQHPLVRQIYIWLEKLTLPITDKLIVVSPLNIEKGLQDGIGRPKDYVVIRSGIELDRFGHPQVKREQTREAWGIPIDATLVGTVTRLSAQKAPLDFVIAAAEVLAQHPGVYFMIVGDGPLRDDVESLAAGLGIAEQLIMTGLRRDIPELMAAFDLFVLSSLWEGLPRVLPQAMATGLPLAATAVDGSIEVIEDGVNGLLTPPGEPEMLAVAISRLLEDRELMERMGAINRERVVEFSATRMVDEIAGLYVDLMTAKNIQSKRMSGNAG